MGGRVGGINCAEIEAMQWLWWRSIIAKHWFIGSKIYFIPYSPLSYSTYRMVYSCAAYSWEKIARALAWAINFFMSFSHPNCLIKSETVQMRRPNGITYRLYLRNLHPGLNFRYWAEDWFWEVDGLFFTNLDDNFKTRHVENCSNIWNAHKSLTAIVLGYWMSVNTALESTRLKLWRDLWINPYIHFIFPNCNLCRISCTSYLKASQNWIGKLEEDEWIIPSA